jgi:hypothetical protein
MPSSDTKAEEWFVNMARRRGWSADVVNRNKCRCPKCIELRKARLLDPGAGLPLGPMPPPKRVNVAWEMGRIDRLNHRKENAAMTTPPTSASTPPTLGPALKPASKPTLVPMATQQPTVEQPTVEQPTVEQKKAMRDLLSSTFDEKHGIYIEDYSDQRIAEEVGVACALVIQLREDWYGKLCEVDPEIEQLRERLVLADAELNKILDNVAATLAGIRADLAALEAKRKPAAA